jgi:hypothetical protein
VHWARQDQSRDWVGQEKESFFGVLEAVTSDRVFCTFKCRGNCLL